MSEAPSAGECGTLAAMARPTGPRTANTKPPAAGAGGSAQGGRSAHEARGAQQRQLRIIAGQWRGRRFRFPDLQIRPTPDRVRETLFNWLQGRVEGTRCLDLFAGSGALGLEALSRRAAAVTFVEQERAAVAALQLLLRTWGAQRSRVVCDSAQHFLAGPTTTYNLVFLDPPFDAGVLPGVLSLLQRGWLAERALVYVERAREAVAIPTPAGWREWRSGAAGAVRYDLFQLEEGTTPP